ncbi:tRNA(Ile)-lysidine synthase [Microcella putealis]|uniref:tRNA(Ile)-lysidine synthase n=1 Tax=Microcella putealis TaxID=337005 RepID=A0A4Q7LNV2_9MICO|nr:tRNA lysidine(34) synthetase TilS [Microcella putealis]RZS55219.1 tRNA(Ile)-lysidine synthase [Microcella putealis]TQM23519.1 tRNA(Ile)-lysidine synthase [Microcella putealis]
MAPEAPEDAERRPRLTPAMADARRAVRAHLADIEAGGLVLVALSGGPDSLALAAATAFEAPRAGLRAGAVIVDHGLQEGSAEVAERAAKQARGLGLDPIQIERVRVDLYGGGMPVSGDDAIRGTGGTGGPEAAARAARYAALEVAAVEHGAAAVLLGHSLDDQAETVLLGLARGSGTLSIAGMAAVAGLYRRPVLGLRRETLAQACVDQGLEPWHDPHNDDDRFARVRVRHRILPLLQRELDPGIVDALARTAAIARDDADALDLMVDEVAEELVELEDGGCSVPVAWIAANPRALSSRLVRLVARVEFGLSLTRAQTLEVLRLATDWHGQGAVHLPGVRVNRAANRIVFTAV